MGGTIKERTLFKKIHLGLGAKFAFLVAGILSITLTLSSAVFIRSQHTMHHGHLMEKGEAVGRFASIIAMEAMLSYDFATIDILVKQITQQKDMVYSAMFDNTGRALSSHISLKNGLLGEIGRTLDGDDPRHAINTLKERSDIMHIAFPVTADRIRFGTVVVGMSTKRFTAQSRKVLVTQSIANIAIIIFLSASIYIVFRFSALRPIKNLASGSERVAAGKLNEPVTVYANDELGYLSETFNSMMKTIDSNLTEVTHHREHLEKEVTQRTAALEKANMLLMTEVIERERAEDELKEYAEKLKQSNKELEGFLFIASHDLQEPLRKMALFGRQLKSLYGKEIGDKGRMYLERMQKAATRIQDLINDLMTFSQVTTMAQPFVPVALDSVVWDVLDDLQQRIQQTKGRVEVGEFTTIDADPLQMRQLLRNLIENALKFHRKEEPPMVTTQSRILNGEARGETGSVAGDDGLCEITVEDNGIGFDEKYKDRIFGVFQHLHDLNDYGGTGAGLAICRKIVDRHGGTITATSAPGQGATFIVRLPVKHPKGEQWISTENA